MAATKHTIVALVADKPGVLNRIASLFRRRGFNIESIVVGHSELPSLSRIVHLTGTFRLILPVIKPPCYLPLSGGNIHDFCYLAVPILYALGNALACYKLADLIRLLQKFRNILDSEGGD